MDNSLQAQFHRLIKVLPWLTKKAQGYVMGEFRHVVPADLDKAVQDMWEAKQTAVDASAMLISTDIAMRNLKLEHSILTGKLNNRNEKIGVLEDALVKAQQARQQSRKGSLAETLTGTSLGFAGRLCITWACVAGIPNTGLAVTTATVLCTVWSLVRGYAVRRHFNGRTV